MDAGDYGGGDSCNAFVSTCLGNLGGGGNTGGGSGTSLNSLNSSNADNPNYFGGSVVGTIGGGAINTGNPCSTDPGLCGGTVYFHSIFLYPWADWALEIENSRGGRRAQVAPAWGVPTEIDPFEFELMLKAIGDDAYSFSWGWYDTPFYNGGRTKSYSGVGCIYSRCYTRTELNYIGEGESLAALGLSKEATHGVVWSWKMVTRTITCLTSIGNNCNFSVSQGTYEMTDVGWDYYNEHYSYPSLSVTSLVQPPGIGPYILVK
jgi:hypothetical protein